jgi:hypothetical protein
LAVIFGARHQPDQREPPENLSRNLASLAVHGVAGSGREIIIANRDALQRLARPDPLIDG